MDDRLKCRHCTKPLTTVASVAFGQHVWCYPPPVLEPAEPAFPALRYGAWEGELHAWAGPTPQELEARFERFKAEGKLMGLFVPEVINPAEYERRKRTLERSQAGLPV